MRARVKRIFPCALSLSACAVAMDLPPSHINRAVALGELVAREAPGRRVRITVADLHSWWHEYHPRVTIRNTA